MLSEMNVVNSFDSERQFVFLVYVENKGNGKQSNDWN